MEAVLNSGNAVIIAFGSGMIMGAAITIVCLVALDFMKERREKSGSVKG